MVQLNDKQLTTMINSREKQATDAYLKFLQAKGAPSGILYRRSRFLDVFMDHLQNQEQTRKAFALALEETLIHLTQEDKSSALNTAREYFLFWTDDIKAIALFNAHYGFSTKEVKWKPKHITLKALTKNLDREVFNEEESLSLENYLKSIANLGADRSIIETRRKFAKIILLRLKEAPTKNHTTYRISVDLTFPLFQTQEIRDLYLEVVREFYHYWENDPIAEELTFGKN
jgi:hypothetical protein